jgi:hypothetical protein
VDEARLGFSRTAKFSTVIAAVGDEARRFSWAVGSGEAFAAVLGESRYVPRRVEFDSIAAAHFEEVSPFSRPFECCNVVD